MPTVEDLAFSNYQTNMQYFKDNHIVLYGKLLALGEILSDGTYPQKYDLEYKDDYFDVIELSSGEFLYNQNSKNISDKLTNTISLKKNEHIFETFYNLEFSKEALEKAQEAKAISTHATTAPIISYTTSHSSPSMHLKKMHKFIFLGIGLGLHVKPILKKTGANIILIVEDNIELFRLSLFTCNYKVSLEKCTPYFAIAQNSDEFRDTFNTFYLDSFIRNHYLKFSLFSNAYDYLIKTIQTFIVSRPETGYSHEYLLYKNIKVLERLYQSYKFLNLTKKSTLFFQDKPILVLGAGPSLHTQASWLEENASSFTIIAAFATLKTLKALDISPDIVIQVDEKVPETENLIQQFDSFEFLDNAIFVFSASVPDILFDTFNKDSIYLIEDRSHYKHNHTFLEAASVGESAYALSLILNPSEIYLLGLDFALKDDGSTHAKGHHLHSQIDTKQTTEIQKSASLTKTTLHVKGNFRDNVITTPLLSMSIPIINAYTTKLKSSNQTIYNLSDGAFLEFTQPLHVKDIKLSRATGNITLNQHISELFYSYSEAFISINESKSLLDRKEQIELYRRYCKHFTESASSSSEQFMQLYTSLVQVIIQSSAFELQEILSIYFLNTSSYIADFFNTKELSNSKKHTKKMKKIVIAQIEKIIDNYEEALVKTLNEEKGDIN